MESFKDRHGNIWTISLTLGSILKAERDTGINLNAIASDETKLRFFDDIGGFVSVLYSLCEKDLEKNNVTSSDAFADCFFGDEIEAAQNAFWKEFINFTPQSKRSTVKKLLDKVEEATLQNMKKAEEMIDSPHFVQQILNVAKKLND